MRNLIRLGESPDEQAERSALASLVAALPERYQPIYGHTELSDAPSRDCADRLAELLFIHDKLSDFLRRPLRVLDLGCAQGFFCFHLAARGAAVHGVDFLAANIAVCKTLAEENPNCRVSFEVGHLESVIERIRVDDYDLVLGLSVFHHLTHERGVPAVRDMLTTLSQKVGASIFEMAVREEPVYWAVSLPASPRELLQGFAFVHRTADYPTHLSGIRRPLYFASNRYWLLNDEIGSFDRFSTESHPGARGVHSETRLYYFGAGRLVKIYLLDNPWTRERNLFEIHAETEFLRKQLENFHKPRLLLAGEHRDEAWLVRELLDGELLSEIIHDGRSYDPEALLDDILNQLVVLERAGLYHGDIRTWNVLVEKNGHAIVIDYGDLGKKPVDCNVPRNIFLSFLIFVREVCTGKPGRAHGVPLPAFSPDELPEPYRTAFWSMLVISPENWSFARLLKDIREQRKPRQKNHPGRAGFQAIFKSLEECGDALDRELGSRARRIREFEATTSRAAGKETELNGALAAQDAQIQQLRDRIGQGDARVTELDAALAARHDENRQLQDRIAQAEARATDLGATLAARDADILRLNQREAEFSGVLDARQTEILHLNQREAELSGVLDARQTEILRLQEHEAGLSAALAAGQAEVHRLQEAASQAETQASRAEAHASELKGTLADRDAELLRVTDRARHIEASWLEMGKTLGERDAELGALGARLQSTQASESALRTELGTAQDALAGSESENARLRDAIGERDASARSAAEREATQRQQIDALYRSTSWRLTAPLRIIRGRFDRIRQKLTRTE